jgi:hypothetical protein
MKKALFIVLFVSCKFYAFSQAAYDTIYSNDEKIACTVKEITADAVKYCYPGEDLINTVFKNSIQKIDFKSGREQIFAEATSLRTVNSADDFDYVSLSHVESEVHGLYKIGDVGAKARGTTVYSNMEKVKERGIRKMKIQAAMMGGNEIYLTQEGTTTNLPAVMATTTNMAGVAYSNRLPAYDGFMNLLNNKMKLKLLKYDVDKLSTDDYDLVKYADTGIVIMNRVYNDNGFIMMDARIEGFDNKLFKVVYYSNDGFILECTDNSDIFENTIYNIRVRF